jgi:nucleotide-binding universal stress UspA family protein
MKRLLIATDQVELSDTIVKRGLGLSRKLHLPVDIVMVVDQATVFSEPNTGMIGAEAFEDQYQLNKDHLEELKKQPGYRYYCALPNRRPKETVVEEAHDEDACMMVIGTQRHARFDRLQMGSTAEYIIGHASIPLLIVPLNK